MARANRRHASGRSNRRVWWAVLGLLFIAGIVLWVMGIGWGAALPGGCLLGFIVRAWLDIGSRGGHVHDTGLTAYGVAEHPRIQSE